MHANRAQIERSRPLSKMHSTKFLDLRLILQAEGGTCPKCGREVSREKLVELAKIGRLAALSAKSRKKHSETQRRHRAAQREWLAAPKPDWLNEGTYSEMIKPKLASVTISTIATTLGVSESYAADIRTGRHRPHPRHWLALARLAGMLLGANDS